MLEKRVAGRQVSIKKEIELSEVPSDGVVTNSGRNVAMTSDNSISAANLRTIFEKSYNLCDLLKLTVEQEKQELSGKATVLLSKFRSNMLIISSFGRGRPRPYKRKKEEKAARTPPLHV